MSRRILVGLALLFLLVTGGLAQKEQLQPGSSLKITCGEVPSLCVIRTIDPSGIVWLPGIGNVAAVDMDLERFRSRLEEMASGKLGRRVHVDVEPYAFKNDPVRVVGFVEHSISRKWVPGLTVLAMLRDVKVRPDGDAEVVSIFQVDGRKHSVDLGTGDAPVQAGDRIEVGPASGAAMIEVVGPVLKPGGMRCTPGLTLARAIQNAGGLTGHADGAHITIRHANGSSFVLDLAKDGSTALEQGDSVAIGEAKLRQFVSISGPVAHPGLIEFRKGMTLTEAIRAAGGDPLKLGDAVKVIGILDKRMRTTKYHLTLIAAKMATDPVLHVADSIVLGGR